MHSTVCLLLLFPLVAPSVDEPEPRLAVKLEQPQEPLRQGEPMMLHLTFTNNTLEPLEVGPFAIEGWGYVGLNAHLCGGRGLSYSIENQVETRVTPVFDGSVDEEENSEGSEGDADVVETEVYEYLIEEAIGRWHTLSIAPRTCQQIEFDLTKTNALWLFDARTDELFPCTYEV